MGDDYDNASDNDTAASDDYDNATRAAADHSSVPDITDVPNEESDNQTPRDLSALPKAQAPHIADDDQADTQTPRAAALDETSKTDTLPKPEPEPEPEPEPKPEPEPIDPLDPHHLLGQTKSQIIAAIGAPDFAFRNGAITIAHYRHEPCQILLFFTSDKSQTGKGALMTHLDIRPITLEDTVSYHACFEALGLRAEFHKTR